MSLSENFGLLIDAVSKIDEVMSIGKSGGEKLPENNESDIDIFIFCDYAPDTSKREAAIKNSGVSVSEMKLSETCGRFWGICDFVVIDGTEICLMYFTASDIVCDIESVLNGSRLDREDEYFYPTGRCATFLNMHILFDKSGYISAMKEKLSFYPPQLAEKLVNHHSGKINDEEDFMRAVSRSDVLFYHSTFESALDHFLQSIFALNHCFFPSRKRTAQYIESFQHKPQNCTERLLKVIESGTRPETLSQSYREWSALCGELLEIIARNGKNHTV